MDALIEEIESLEAILMDDVKITRNPETDFPELIETTVHPTTGENDDQKYVCVTLQIKPSPKYPDERPDFKLRNPRGLDDGHLTAIEQSIGEKLDASIGQPVVFDLIDLIRDFLSASNIPTGQCVICLYGFQEGDEFTKTACYHYLHSHCLAIWLTNARRNYEEELEKMPAWQRQEVKPFQPWCPVCREPIIDVNVEQLREARAPQELENAPHFQLTEELRSLQAHMSRLYLQQKQKGGIIDAAGEEKNVISIDDGRGSPEAPKPKPRPVQPQPAAGSNSRPAKPKPAAVAKQPSEEDETDGDGRKERRGGRGNRYHRRGGRHDRHGKNR